MSQEPKRDRPAMGGDYGIDRAESDDQLSWQWVTAQMEQARNYWVATTRPDGRPHVMPVWGLWVDGEFYFSTGFNSRKGRNLAANPAIAVHLESGDDVVIFEGVAEKVLDQPFLDRLAEIYNAKYPGYNIEFKADNSDSGMFRVRAKTVFGWLEKDFVKSASRWKFD